MSEHPLTLRPTILTGDRLTDDYCVWREGRRIGRIRLAHEYSNANWTWFINPPLAIPAWGTGAADSLEDAKLAFRTAWERFYDRLAPEDIVHWHANDGATEAQGYNRPPDAK